METYSWLTISVIWISQHDDHAILKRYIFDDAHDFLFAIRHGIRLDCKVKVGFANGTSLDEFRGQVVMVNGEEVKLPDAWDVALFSGICEEGEDSYVERRS